MVTEEYLENVYGMSGSALHQGAPTDRFIAAWKITTPHVERRIARIGAPASPIPVLRDASLVNAPVVNATCTEEAWCIPTGEPDLTRDDNRLFVEIPARFGEMLQQAPARALEWRLVTRRIFTSYFARNYRVVDFLLNRDTGGGRYLLEKTLTSTRVHARSKAAQHRGAGRPCKSSRSFTRCQALADAMISPIAGACP